MINVLEPPGPAQHFRRRRSATSVPALPSALPRAEVEVRTGRAVTYAGLALASVALAAGAARQFGGVAGRVEHRSAERDGVRTHYGSLG